MLPTRVTNHPHKQRLRAGAAGYMVLRGGYVRWHRGSSVLSAANRVERPTPWSGVQGSRDADIHGSSACAVETSGNVRCEGLEDPNLSATALQVGVGIGFACALTSDGVVSRWGKNDRGQTGQLAAPGAHAATPVIVTAFVSTPVEHD